jgi:hypothetical protein
MTDPFVTAIGIFAGFMTGLLAGYILTEHAHATSGIHADHLAIDRCAEICGDAGIQLWSCVCRGAPEVETRPVAPAFPSTSAPCPVCWSCVCPPDAGASL